MHASSHIAKKHIIGSVQIDLRSFYQALTRTNTHEGERGDAGGGREEYIKVRSLEDKAASTASTTKEGSPIWLHACTQNLLILPPNGQDIGKTVNF